MDRSCKRLDGDLSKCSAELDMDAEQDLELRSKYRELCRQIPSTTSAAKAYRDKIASIFETMQRKGEYAQAIKQQLRAKGSTFAMLNYKVTPKLETPKVRSILHSHAWIFP